MNIRKATEADIDSLVALRKIQLVDEGISPDKDIDTELYEFFTNKLKDNSLIQLVVEDQDKMIACGAIMIYDFPPSYTNQTGKKAYITNMYTADSYRGKGIASKLLNMLIDETKQQGISKMWLGASQLGRPIYQKFGFKDSDEWMELDLQQDL
ncbi:GNAT family N-acetyltransferase [Alkalicoccobacillus porphyridii]|uniref:GNAT family N-acetyltransferase n=1 Tax=Alkalicoccobacillus porphyridii TaxID=2597270 RepID=A0A554A217_9BACI|nr:GNAT family N-acetyltransferase [Alkalicoccobacillus porphyridii]TSB47737.1 GNAT family N-acetyltransferase [Alkalicoccobacillus porphyridii]